MEKKEINTVEFRGDGVYKVVKRVDKNDSTNSSAVVIGVEKIRNYRPEERPGNRNG